jgi:hypothetical protein
LIWSADTPVAILSTPSVRHKATRADRRHLPCISLARTVFPSNRSPVLSNVPKKLSRPDGESHKKHQARCDVRAAGVLVQPTPANRPSRRAYCCRRRPDSGMDVAAPLCRANYQPAGKAVEGWSGDRSIERRMANSLHSTWRLLKRLPAANGVKHDAVVSNKFSRGVR